MKDKIFILDEKNIGNDFIPKEFLPKGEDEYYLRNRQQKHGNGHWRQLKASEVEALVLNGNTAEDWDKILVHDRFNPARVRNCTFFGMVRIGDIRNATLKHHDLEVPVGLTNSQIISCDIGDNVAIHHVRYLSHFIIGDACVLTNIDEMNTTNHAKFGNGILKDGETESVLAWMDIMNETGARKVLPFDGMITADAYIWAKYREDRQLMDRLKTITLASVDPARGYYGEIGEQTVIKNSRILKDVKIGSLCYIKGANKLKNLTIHSSPESPTQIGEGVEAVNGIIGYGCRIFYGCKAVRFIMGNNSNLKYGGRLINSFLGSNSTISCCEVLNNLIFPSHEQHHNNSFLIAALVKGQSNVAAGATLGSNHNSRANDNEIVAGRGFWSGLCTSIKHPSTFASFTLIAKGSYPAELHIPLPFSLVNNQTSRDELEIMPAFWWLYNMYAFARNEWKFQTRDKRVYRMQHIEYDTLAPDTAEEIVNALEILESRMKLDPANRKEFLLDTDNREAVFGKSMILAGLEIERSNRPVILLKPFKGYQAYLQMLFYYGMCQVLVNFRKISPLKLYEAFSRAHRRDKTWINLGGQLVRDKDVENLFMDIKNGALDTWKDIHRRHDCLFKNYPRQKIRHAMDILRDVFGITILSKADLVQWLTVYGKIHDLITARVYESRKKDYDNPFKKLNFNNAEEMEAVLGKLDDNAFILAVRKKNVAIHDEITRWISE